MKLQEVASVPLVLEVAKGIDLSAFLEDEASYDTEKNE